VYKYNIKMAYKIVEICENIYRLIVEISSRYLVVVILNPSYEYWYVDGENKHAYIPTPDC